MELSHCVRGRFNEKLREPCVRIPQDACAPASVCVRRDNDRSGSVSNGPIGSDSIRWYTNDPPSGINSTNPRSPRGLAVSKVDRSSSSDPTPAMNALFQTSF